MRSNILIFFAFINSYLIAQPTEIVKRSESFFGVHFDLHASEDITDAGRTLTAAMIDTFLRRVKPDFIQIDCKGHPGISSYPTQVGYHVRGFEKDPLRLWREITEQNKVGLYMHFSGVWDEKVVKEHPEWAMIKSDGKRNARKVSFFSPYLDTFLIPQLKELSAEYHVDGAWIDGECWAVEPDYGTASLERFTRETGIAEIPRTVTDRYYPEFLEYTRRLFREHLRKYVEAIHEFNPDFQITSNWAYSSMMPEPVTIPVDFLSGDVTPQNGVFRAAFEARCLAPQGKPWDLMAWGFSWNGGEMPMNIKSAVQLKQEAAQIIAMGGGVQIYFQQNRDLSLKPWLAYMLEDIGKFCRDRQAFCHKAVPVPQIALLYPSSAYQKSAPVPYSRSLEMLQGTLYALLDAQLPVEIIMEHNLTGKTDRYPVIIIPECDYLEPSFREEILNYVQQGGKLVVIGPATAGLFKTELGIRSLTPVSRSASFIAAAGKMGSIRSELLGTELAPDTRIWSRFYEGSDFTYPGKYAASTIRTLGKGRIAGIYFNAGTAYKEYKTPVIRDFIKEIVRELMPSQLVEVTGSNLVHMALSRLNNKFYIHLMNVSGEHTNEQALSFDEVPALHDLTLRIHCPEKPSNIILQPEGLALPFTWNNGTATVQVEEVALHEILEIF
jgi:hypothetical protein